MAASSGLRQLRFECRLTPAAPAPRPAPRPVPRPRPRPRSLNAAKAPNAGGGAESEDVGPGLDDEDDDGKADGRGGPPRQGCIQGGTSSAAEQCRLEQKRVVASC